MTDCGIERAEALLRRFAAYVEKIYKLRRLVDRLRDERQAPRIPTRTVWLLVFGMFVSRLRSFNALEQQLRLGGVWADWAGAPVPSPDTLGRVLGQLHLEELRRLLVSVNRRAWRNKAIHFRPGESYRVVAVDGHELGASRARCCSQCLVREIKKRDKKVEEYYHRVVVAQWVGVTPPAILDIEVVRRDEGEVSAARRLLERVLDDYGRLVDVITADALYLEGGFIGQVLEAGKHVVVVMKQQARELYQDAFQLRRLVEPQVIQDAERTSRLWDLDQLTSFSSVKQPVRVVWTEEQTLSHRIIGGKRQDVLEDKTWIWVTNLPASVVPATKIQLWGHARWNLENRGFNELVNLWHMDHYFIHQTNAIEALLLTLAVAFLTTYLFYERNLKPAARVHCSRLSLATLFLFDLSAPEGASPWSSPG